MPIDFQPEATAVDFQPEHSVDFQADEQLPEHLLPAPGTPMQRLAAAGPPTIVDPMTQQKAAEIAAIPELSLADAGKLATTPFVNLPRVGEPGTALRGVSDAVAGAVEQAALTPASGALGASLLVPGLRTLVGTTLAAAATKSAATELGEASVTGNREHLEHGLLTAALGSAGALGAVAGPARAADVAATASRLADSTAPAPIKPFTFPSTDNTLGIAHPSTAMFNRVLDIFATPVDKLSKDVRNFLGAAANETAPRITTSDRLAGEAAGRAAAAPMVGKQLGYQFADQVLEATGVEDLKFGVALKENDLRGLKQSLTDQAAAAEAKGDLASAADLAARASKVTSLIDQPGSPFKTLEDYQSFMAEPATQEALALHESLWTEQKDPLFRQANDLDPEIELPNRGLDYPTRINLTVADEGSKTRVGGPVSGVRQLATLLRRDKFAQRAEGTGTTYEGSYRETMGSAFAHEYPVAAQHEFINKLIDAGDAVVGKATELKGEPTEGFLLKLRPWAGNMLQVRKSLAREYGAISGLEGGLRLGKLTEASNFLTKQSVQGLGEGTSHAANLLMKIFTGVGPTANPLVNAALKTAGRADLLYSLPRVILRGLQASDTDMLALAKINAAKEPYAGWLSSKLLNPIDRGIRLVSADIYKSMAKQGWVADTETGLREFVNEAGNYNKATQNVLVRNLRSTGLNPFATGFSTAAAQSLRRGVFGPGMKATTLGSAIALRADILGGYIGTIAVVAALNKYLTGSVHGLPGTPLMSASWRGKDGKPHYVDVGNLTGFTRGYNMTGVKPYLEARDQGLSKGDALTKAIGGPESAIVGMVAGPAVRFGATAITGKNPYGNQVAPIADPATDSVLHSQVVNNIKEALQEANPILDTLVKGHEGMSAEALAQRQLTRWAPRSGLDPALLDKLPQITAKHDADAFIKDVAKQAQKLTPKAADALFSHAEDVISELDDPKVRLRALKLLRFIEKQQ